MKFEIRDSTAALENFHCTNGWPLYSQIFYQPCTLTEMCEYQGHP